MATKRLLIGLGLGLGALEAERLKHKHHHYFFTQLLPRIKALEMKVAALEAAQKSQEPLFQTIKAEPSRPA